MARISLCPRCGSTFEQAPGVGRWRKYCAPGCDEVGKICAVCEDVFVGRPEQVYCSDPCRFEAMSRRNRADPEEQARRAALGHEAAVAATRARRKTDWYRTVDGEHEHRTVAAKTLGRPLRPGEVVHHEDLNKLNNDPRNLIVFPSQGDHARHHGRGHPGNGRCDCEGIRLEDLV